MIHLACRCAEPEVRAESVPKIQAKRKRHHGEQPKAPDGASVLEHHAWVARVATLVEGSGPEVAAIGDQAEAREELDQVRQRHSAHFEDDEQGKRQNDADDWPGPDNQQRVGIGGYVRLGNRQRVKDHPFNGATRGNSTKDMPKFVNRHHCQPAQRQEGADQENLVKS